MATQQILSFQIKIINIHRHKEYSISHYVKGAKDFYEFTLQQNSIEKSGFQYSKVARIELILYATYAAAVQEMYSVCTVLAGNKTHSSCYSDVAVFPL